MVLPTLNSEESLLLNLAIAALLPKQKISRVNQGCKIPKPSN
jgi:hypothetical protein